VSRRHLHRVAPFVPSPAAFTVTEAAIAAAPPVDLYVGSAIAYVGCGGVALEELSDAEVAAAAIAWARCQRARDPAALRARVQAEHDADIAAAHEVAQLRAERLRDEARRKPRRGLRLVRQGPTP
jgi:hypothetical protein